MERPELRDTGGCVLPQQERSPRRGVGVQEHEVRTAKEMEASGHEAERLGSGLLNRYRGNGPESAKWLRRETG